MEDAVKEFVAYAREMGLHPVTILAIAWGITERRARDKEVEAHNATREKRLVESGTAIEAIDRLAKSVDIMITAFRIRGDH